MKLARFLSVFLIIILTVAFLAAVWVMDQRNIDRRIEQLKEMGFEKIKE